MPAEPARVNPAHADDYWNRELETRPWHRLELWQAAHIARLIDRLRANSDFYQPRLARRTAPLRSFAGLAEYGYTTFADILRAQEDTPEWIPLGSIQTADKNDIIHIVLSESTNLGYGLTQRDTELRTDAVAQTLYTCGVRANDVVAHLLPMPGALAFADALRRLGATTLFGGSASPERLLERMLRLHVGTLLADGEQALNLAQCCRELYGRSLSAMGIHTVLSAGAPAPASAHARLAQACGESHVRACMGIDDVLPGMWSACSDAGGMHFNAQRCVAVELIDPASGAQLAWREGAQGEAVYTTFEREATPLLRLRSGDYIGVTALSCACGRSSPKIEYLGRVSDFVPAAGAVPSREAEHIDATV